MYINPDLEAFIQQMLSDMADAPTPSEPPTLEQRRAALEGMVGTIAPPPRTVHQQREIQIPGPRGDIRSLLVTPRETDEKLPVLVWYHGGGTVMLSPESELPAITAAAIEADCIVLAPRLRSWRRKIPSPVRSRTRTPHSGGRRSTRPTSTAILNESRSPERARAATLRPASASRRSDAGRRNLSTSSSPSR